VTRFCEGGHMQLSHDDPAPIGVDDVALEPASRSVRCGETSIALTAIEFRILRVMLESANRIVDRAVLCQQGVGRSWKSSGRTLDTHISNLRKKLGPTADGTTRIKAVQGAGYIYRTPLSVR
jgi:two-component system response regulator CpxR